MGMNVLTPDIQSELLKAARRSPVVLLFSGDNDKGKTLASELLAVHFDTYLFRVDLARMIAQHPEKAEENLERIFSRAREAGDLLYFDGADALLDGHEAAVPGIGEALDFFRQQLRRCRGVIIVSVSGKSALDAKTLECFGPVIHFPAA